MAEIFEIEEIPTAVSNGSSAANSSLESTGKADSKNQSQASSGDRHLPNFDFNGYPQVPGESGSESPRILDDVWQRFEK